ITSETHPLQAEVRAAARTPNAMKKTNDRRWASRKRLNRDSNTSPDFMASPSFQSAIALSSASRFCVEAFSNLLQHLRGPYQPPSKLYSRCGGKSCKDKPHSQNLVLVGHNAAGPCASDRRGIVTIPRPLFGRSIDARPYRKREPVFLRGDLAAAC